MTAIINGFRGKTHVKVGRVKFSPGQQSSLKIPQDIVIKEMIMVARGTIGATYAAATPVLRSNGVLDGIIEQVNISRRGSDRVKALYGTKKLTHNMERQFGKRDPDIFKVNSANLSGAVSFGTPTLGATTQNTAFQEAKSIMFENKLSGNWAPTLFDTMGLNTAQINFIWAPVANVQDPEDAAVATAWSHDIEIDVYASCADYLLGNQSVAVGDWLETSEELSFSGVQSGQKHFITPEGMLQGMLISGLHQGEKPIDYEMMKKTYLEIRYLGTRLVEGSLADFAEIDGLKTYLGERKKGAAYVSFLNMSSFDSGLIIGENKQLELTVYTDPAINYATPHRLRFEYDQIKFNQKALPEIKA